MPRKKLTLEAVNDRLAAADVELKVWQRGDRLSLCGTLPPKTGSSRQKWFQQSIPLKVYAKPAGLGYAESKALGYGSLLAQHRFSWVALDQGDAGRADSCEVWIEKFKENWLKDQDPVLMTKPMNYVGGINFDTQAFQDCQGINLLQLQCWNQL